MLTPSLYQFFNRQLQHGFDRRGLHEPDTVAYISEILTRFAQTRELYPIRGEDGRPLEYLVDLQAVWRQARQPTAAGGHARQRRIVRHIGEYSLFMSGLFRERLESRGQLAYYIANGSSAFWHCADNVASNSPHWRIFRRLYRDFAHITHVLDKMRRNNFGVRAGESSPAQAMWRL